jgi:hypothetical protein
MQEVVDKVMQTYGMMKTLSAEEPQADLSSAELNRVREPSLLV